VIFENFYDGNGKSQTGFYTYLLDRDPIAHFLLEKRKKEKFTVIDVGAAAAPWSLPVVDATVDYKLLPSSSLHFQLDLHEERTWQPILEFVNEHGKFDFSLCCHTVEDLHYPPSAFRFLQTISKQGFISVPSVHRELKHVGHYSKGYDHHFWMFRMNPENELVMIPKMNHIEHNQYPISQDLKDEELQFLWKGEIITKHFWSYPHTQIAELYQSDLVVS